MSPSKKPFVVIFTGAFHEAQCMRLFVQALADMGYDSEAFSLPSVGPDCAGKTLHDDSAGLRRIIESVLQPPAATTGRDVVVMAHSLASFSCSDALTGLDPASRSAAGESTAVLGFVSLAGFIAIRDKMVYNLMGDVWPVWIIPNYKQQFVCAEDYHEYLYGDVEEELAASIVLHPQSLAVFHFAIESANILEEAWSGRRGYIRCLADKAIPIVVQDSMLAASAVAWSVRTLDSSHSPFLSMPKDLAMAFDGLCDEFGKLM